MKPRRARIVGLPVLAGLAIAAVGGAGLTTGGSVPPKPQRINRLQCPAVNSGHPPINELLPNGRCAWRYRIGDRRPMRP